MFIISNGAGKLKSLRLASANVNGLPSSVNAPCITMSCQFFMRRNSCTSSCCQLRLPYIADLRLPPCITLRPISLVANRNGIGPLLTPPVLLSGLPDPRNLLTSTPIPPPVIKQEPTRFHRSAHSSRVSSSALCR